VPFRALRGLVSAMRVTGGIIGRREIRAPKGDVRPTQDKVRAALFNSLGEAVVGARVLDLFAGSGALGLEAWSRGAAHVCWVELDRRAFQTLEENVKSLCSGEGGETELRQSDAFSFLKRGAAEPFHLVLADPPYGAVGAAELLLALEEHGSLAPGGVFVFEQRASEPALERSGWEILRDRTYGGTRLVMYRRETP
jgi:16S rRNA (guanine966-N2)-methyltransferase